MHNGLFLHIPDRIIVSNSSVCHYNSRNIELGRGGLKVAKALVFVLVPYSVSPSSVSEYAHELLKPHAMPDDGSRGWYDYLCRIGPVFDDPIAEGRLPHKQKRVLHRHVCEIERLPPDPIPYALVTPDGVWHACAVDIWDYWGERGRPEPSYYAANAAAAASWPTRYADLVAAHPYCWVVASWAHS